MKKSYSAKELIKIVTDSFEAEKTGNIELGKSLLSDDFKKTSMVVSGGKTFPSIFGSEISNIMKDAYSVRGREFHIWNVAANEKAQTVFIELAEVEPTTKRKRVWPYVLVCQIEKGKIKRSRHYGDPAILENNIRIEHIREAISD